jgi:BolA family transcriptional regulator, general stress-responsive regulator
MTGMKEVMTDKLGAAFQPQSLKVIDESHQHHGHGGWREGGETHFRVQMVTAAFSGKSRIDRHRMVNAALADELKASVHALALELKAPEDLTV